MAAPELAAALEMQRALSQANDDAGSLKTSPACSEPVKAGTMEELYKWKFSLMMPVVAMLCYALWSRANSVWWNLVELAFNLTLPILIFVAVIKSLGTEEPPEHMKHSALSWIPNMKVRYFMVIIVLPCTAFFDWQMKKRTYAALGPTVNATIAAGVTTREFIKSMSSFALLPMVSMVSAAYQSGNHARLMRQVGTGLGIALAAGLVGQLLIMVFARSMLSLFEGEQPLLPNAAALLRTYSASFPCVIVMETLMAVLAGTNQHLLIGESICPIRVMSLTNTILFMYGVVDLHGTLAIQAVVEVSAMLVAGWMVLATLRRTWTAKLEAQNGREGEKEDADSKAPLAGVPEPTFRMLLPDVTPTREVFLDMIQASANTFLRNMALRLKGFASGICATRLGNLQGSAFAVQGTLTAYLSGPAGSTGLFTANVAPMLLSINALGVFAFSVKAIFWQLAFFSGLWFYFAAWSGQMRTLRFGGVIPNHVTNEMLGWNSTTLTLGNSTAAWNATEANLTAEQLGNLTTIGDTVQDYLGVITPLNHWLWAWGTIANEVAAPFDGVIMVLGGYDYMGLIYAGDLLLVLLPALCASHFAAKRGVCVLPGAPSGCNSYTGVRLAELLWGLARVVSLLVAVFGHELGKLRRRQLYHDTACSKEVVLGYIEERCKASPEEVEEQKERRRSSFFYRFTNEAPMGVYARERGTTTEVLSRNMDQLRKSNDEEFKRASEPFWRMYGDWM